MSKTLRLEIERILYEFRNSEDTVESYAKAILDAVKSLEFFDQAALVSRDKPCFRCGCIIPTGPYHACRDWVHEENRKLSNEINKLNEKLAEGDYKNLVIARRALRRVQKSHAKCEDKKAAVIESMQQQIDGLHTARARLALMMVRINALCWNFKRSSSPDAEQTLSNIQDALKAG